MHNAMWKNLSALVVGVCVALLVCRQGGASGAVAASQPATTQSAKPPLGVNLEFVNDYARSMVFVDAMKSARKFGSPDAPWDENAPLGADGWPTGDAGVVVMADTPVPAGDYTFSCTGNCDLGTPAMGCEIHKETYDRATRTKSAVITLAAETKNFFLSFKHTNGGIKNIRLLRPGYPLNTDQTFTKEFLNAIAPFTALRLMDFTRTNSTTVTTWDQRPKLTDPLQSSTNGVAWEYGILLANQSGKDLWINVPAQADDEYVKQLTRLLKSTLNKDRNVYVEYSNEVWNSIFPQYGQNLDAAKRQVAAGDKLLNDDGKDDNQYYWSWKRISQRIVQISDIFRSEWGDDAINTRIRPVLASQSANPFMTRMQVDFIAQKIGPPSKFIYGIAGAPYLGPGGKYNERDDITLDDLFQNGIPAGFVWVKDCIHQYGMIARYYRLHSLCYEAAMSLEGDHSLPVKIKANYDPRMGQPLTDYLNLWYSQGGDLFMYYGLAGTYSKYGCWGLTDDIRKSTPKMKAVADFANGPLPPVSAGTLVPAKILAADFDANDGGHVEDSGDGGKNVGFLHNNNTLDYLIRVNDAGTYAITLQTATAQDGAAIEVLLSGQSLGNVACPSTGDWHKWGSSHPVPIKLDAGLTVLRLRIAQEPVNIRSITIQKTGA